MGEKRKRKSNRIVNRIVAFLLTLSLLAVIVPCQPINAEDASQPFDNDITWFLYNDTVSYGSDFDSITPGTYTLLLRESTSRSTYTTLSSANEELTLYNNGTVFSRAEVKVYLGNGSVSAAVNFPIELEAGKTYNLSIGHPNGLNTPVASAGYGDVNVSLCMQAASTTLSTKSNSTGTVTQQSYLENTNSIPTPSYSLTVASAPVVASPDTYYLKSSSDPDYSSSINVPSGMPNSPGQYSLKAVWGDTNNYIGTDAICNFTVYDAFEKVAIQVPNATYGESISPAVTLDGANASDLSVNCTYMYKTAGADDSSYSATVPTAVGDYVVKVTANYNYPGITEEIGTATTTFTIGKREGNGSITVPNIRYGAGKVTPQVSSDLNGTNNVTITYKQQGAADSTYTSTVPTIPGKYTARAVFAATDTTKEYTATTNFEILKATGTAQVTAANVFYGEAVLPKASTGVTNAGTPVFEYKLMSSANSTYSTTVPTAVGSYTVRATYPESANYFAFSSTADFTISYMPAPEYTVTGTKGTNDFYTSAVTITPAAGYQVATSLDGEYADRISVTNIGDVPMVYFRNAQTGAKSDGVSLENIKIDISAPLISNMPEAEKLFEDNWNLTVSDLNLARIMVNGEPMDFTGSSAQITFDAEGGRKEYHIEIMDRAGNVTEYDFVLSAKWLQEGIIPVGEPVVLEPDTPYVLSEGENVTIEGDATQYAGGMTVYVREAGQFTFN